jgi:PAS domain S-box-containing protein
MAVQSQPQTIPPTDRARKLWLQQGIRWLASIGSVAIATCLVVHLQGIVEPTPNALFFCAVIFSAWFGGWGPGILSAILSVLAVKYYATAPFHQFSFSASQCPRLIFFLATGLFISWLTSRQKKAEAALRALSDELDGKVRERTAELQKTNELLQAREREIRAIVDNTPDWIIRLDRMLRRTYVNPAFINTMGVPKEVLLGSPSGSMGNSAGFQFSQEESEIFRSAATRVLETGQPLSLENAWTFKTGKRHFVTHLEPEFDADGKVTSVLAIVRDITEIKNKDEQLRETEAELAHIARVTMLGEITASIAHEVKQPLTAIVNNANACAALLDSDSDDRLEIREALSDIVNDGERAAAVVERVRALVKKSPPNLAPCDLRSLVTNVLALPRPDSVPDDFVVTTNLPQPLPVVLGDEVQLQQVLLNLVMNGMEAMAQVPKERHKLEISARLESHEEKPGVVLSVKDCGTGLSASETDRIFNAFYTTKRAGLGMGLAISRSIVESHGGRLWVESVEGQGATFLFWLPELNKDNTDR